MYAVKMTKVFEKKFYKSIPKSLQDQTWRRINKLAENPFMGKPLGNIYFRELKLGKFRIYYTIFDDEVVVLLLDISDKKEQQKVIEAIRLHKELFAEYVKNLNLR